MDSQTRREIETAVQALDDALTGLVGFLMTLRPTLRNKTLQIGCPSSHPATSA